MSDNIQTQHCTDCKQSLLVEVLTKRVDKVEERQDKMEDKIEASYKETNISISTLKENLSEQRAYSKATLEQISDLKSMIKSNNESNLTLIMGIVQSNNEAILNNNKANLEANKSTQEISKEIEINNTSGKIEITKGKLALYGTIIGSFVTIITLLVNKFF